MISKCLSLLRGVMKNVDKDSNRQELQARIREIRDGNQEAFLRLLADYTPLIVAQVTRYATDVSEQDREDLYQEARWALYRSALNYDMEQTDVEFGLFAKICISNALVSQLRNIARRPQVIRAEDVWAQEEGAEDPTRSVLARESAEALSAKIRALLSPYENSVWWQYVAGRSVTEIAANLKKTPHSVENAVYRIRQKLRRAIGDESTH